MGEVGGDQSAEWRLEWGGGGSGGVQNEDDCHLRL
jgi:hypothetical protein